MALMQCNFFSETLGLSCSMNVIVPQKTGLGQIGIKTTQNKKNKYKVLYLLHGMSDDHSIWLRRTSVERYVSEYSLVVVMPNVERSYYTNMASGPQYWTFISEELPQIVRSFFPISERRDDNFVAGLSMGGYGAFKMALRNPDRFAAAASFSGALTLDWMKNNKDRKVEMERIFGKKLNPCDDLLRISQDLAQSGKFHPRLYMSCGSEDFLYKDNLKFKKHLEKLGYALTYSERPGSHDWGFWDIEIQKFLKWLKL